MGCLDLIHLHMRVLLDIVVECGDKERSFILLFLSYQ